MAHSGFVIRNFSEIEVSDYLIDSLKDTGAQGIRNYLIFYACTSKPRGHCLIAAKYKENEIHNFS